MELKVQSNANYIPVQLSGEKAQEQQEVLAHPLDGW
jgi:hypothetical protein